ncbi:PMS1 protein homolog 1-like isoform X3 [Daphnia pulex]|uniref:PMS1 protein homolog 1-like isoform X3 n=1 Tax=Daphnia pulex TaxID=6669 RepID=UPI001EDE5DA8|nr:PMS1 protein homolog 1-like isoform X3 [Daphnia pulex]XP_046453621.1 PMS1 protein homolog 1-like isoform X3 [Daphnia pulex]
MVEKKIISELPPSTVQLITATQIATSVCNIVKELVENSLDASSTVVRVKLENSGLSKIEVTDNGSGVSKENVLKMALPHYTSKISQHQDLEALSTYGFRGEALAAICAVAKLSVTTKTAEDPVASTYTMDSNGDVVDVKPSHLSQGTLVVMTSLFWNIPVRKQYYQTPKRKKDELIKVEELLLSYGLIHPELHLSLHHDHSLIWQKNRATDFTANIRQTLGHEICSNMEFISEDEVIQMVLVVPKRTAPLEICYRNRPDRCFTFINQRPVISKDIEKLMKELYGFIRDGDQKSAVYPIFIVSLQFPGDEVDVNVEPNKTKVLLKRQGEVLELIRKRVSDILGTNLVAEKPTEVNLQTAECENSTLAVNPDVTEVRMVEETVLEDQHKSHTQAPLHTQFETTFDSQIGFRQLESTRIDSVDGFPEDDCLFRGFDEPFQVPVEKESFETNESASNEPEIIAIGSDQWSRGLATNSDGQIVHAIQVLRGQPHLAKRLSDPPVLGNLAKKPKLIETMETSRIVGSSPSLLETVNGRVRKIPADPFGEYCKDVRNEILSQDPTMSFTELSQNLNNGWKNLDKNSREKYEMRSETNKQRYNANKLRTPKKSSMSNTSLDRYLLGSQTPVIRTERTPSRSVVASAPPPKRTSSNIDFSMDILNQSLESSQLKTKDQWFCLKKIESGSWLCSNRNDVMAVNFTRLYEMILYTRLVNEHVIPSRTVNNPMLIDKKTFGDLMGWRKLLSLPSEWETATTRTITDSRVVANGVGIRLGVDSDDAGVVVYQVPANVQRFDLNDVRNLLRQVTKDGSTVESCRPGQIIMYLKSEAARLAAGRCTEPETNEVCELLEQWLSTDPENVCLHGEPVFWSHSIGALPANKENTY